MGILADTLALHPEMSDRTAGRRAPTEARDMIVYRMQNEKGRGPFQPGITNQWINYLVDRRQLVPWFLECHESVYDEILSSKLHKGTACLTKEQLQEWFDRQECARLAVLGFHPVEMQAEQIFYEGKYQVVFGRRIPLSEDTKRIDLWDNA